MTRLAVAAVAAALLAAAAEPAPAQTATKPRAQRTAAETTPPSYGVRDDVVTLATEIAARRNLGAAWVVKQLAQARKIESVQRLMMPPPAGQPKNWAAYRDRFVEPRRIAAGAEFWRANERWLAAAEARWGVPADVVVGVIGVETYYGRFTGGFRVIDALATLSFDFPTGRRDRTPYFREELEEFLVWCDREGVDPQEPKGSFAGAMGLPQFMPGSINRWAVDFDGNGHVDLAGSAADAIGSVAHYLAEHGWRRDMPTHYAVQPPADEAARNALLAPDIVPSFSAAQFTALGAELPEAARTHEGPLALVMLENGGAAPSYVAGTRNFYAITRYNWSSYYALAVITLGDAVRRAR
jgi:membrane-bound lytic murein transglycosylase B